MSLVKIPFLFTGLLSGYGMLTPPQPRVPTRDRHREVKPFERWFSATVRIHAIILKALACGPPLVEMIIIIADHFPHHPLSAPILSTLVRGPISLTNRITCSRAFLASWVLGTFAGLVRCQCYYMLGRFFTFEVSIRNGHTLVQDGWYGVVRHPSYVSGALSLVGLGLMHTIRGSWLRECGILQTRAGRILAGVYAGLTIYVNLSMVWRSMEEDRILRKHFGQEWEEYAERVRWRWIPYIF